MIARSQGGLHSTGRNEKVEHSLKRIWNEFIFQKDKGIEDKQTKVGLHCCQTTHCRKTEQVKEFGYLAHKGRLRGQPGHVPPIIVKRLCIYRFFNTFSPTPIFWFTHPIFLTSLRQ